MFYTPRLGRRRRHGQRCIGCGLRHFLKHHISCGIHFQSEMPALKRFEMLEHLEIVTGGKQQIGIAGANRYVRDNVGYVRSDHGGHTRGDFLVAPH